jgi:tRNA 2-thiouridine synthesizing protein A
MFGKRMKRNYDIDLVGFKCPIPILKIRKKIKDLKKGDTLSIIATDNMIKIDLPIFCKESECRLIEMIDQGGQIFCKIEII